jgi:hypothetical protein
MQKDERRTLVFVLSTFFLLLIFALPFAASAAVHSADRCRQMLARVKTGSIDQLMVAPREERHLLGLLVETKQSPRLLAVGSYLSSHEAMSHELENRGGRITSYLWGGELALFNPGLRRDIGFIRIVNDSCGLISFLQKTQRLNGEGGSAPALKNSNRYLKFMVESICPALSHQSHPVEMIAWSSGNDGSRHLHPKLNGRGGNFRHAAINALFELRIMDPLARVRRLSHPAFQQAIQQISLLIEVMRDAHPEMGNFEPVLKAHQRILRGEFVSADEVASLILAYHVLNGNLHALGQLVTVIDMN